MTSLEPPPESRIRATSDRSGFTQLILPPRDGGAMRYFASAFLAFWLCAWAMGWLSAARQVFSPAREPADMFLVFWLGAWTLGGAFAGFALFNLLRPAVPETLVLAKPDLLYDTGRQPPEFGWGRRHRNDFWKEMFRKRKQFGFRPEALRTLRLPDTEEGNRLTIDGGVDRINLGRGLTEIDREWLFARLQHEYSL